jgi:hypothetical protein
MPANVSENMRPTVIAGLAKLAERRLAWRIAAALALA